MRPDPLDYVLGCPDPDGGTARDLARRLGVTRAHASALLNGLPARLVLARRAEDVSEVRWVPTSSAFPGDVDAEAAWQRFTSACQRSRRRARSQVERLVELIGKAQVALFEGDFETLRGLLLQPGMDLGAARRLVPPKWRERLGTESDHLWADMLMQKGRAEAALRILRRVLPRVREPLRRATLLALAGASHRIAGNLGESERAYQAAIDVADQASTADRVWIRGHVFGNRVAPLLAAGQFMAAEHSVEQAIDSAGDSFLNQVQIVLRHVQVLSSQGRGERARSEFERIGSVRDLPRWLRGWAARIEASFLSADMDSESWNGAMLTAWRLADGYGFQQTLLVARIAEAPRRFEPALWPPVELGQLAWRVAKLHRERHGARPGLCPVCAGQPLPVRAAHALGVGPGSLDPMWRS